MKNTVSLTNKKLFVFECMKKMSAKDKKTRAEIEEENKQLAAELEKNVEYKPQQSTTSARGMKIDKRNQANADKPRSSGGLRKGFTGLGDPTANKIHYIKPGADAGDQGRFNLKYCDANTSNASTSFPTFAQSPPFVIASSSFVGGGRENPKNDSVLERKFNLVALYGILKKDAEGNILDELDIYPIFPKNRSDIWKNNNPMGHTEKEKISLSYEINSFYKHYQALHMQIVRYFAADPDGVVFLPSGNERADNILKAAEEIADQWAEEKEEERKRQKETPEGTRIPKYSMKEWKKQRAYQIIAEHAKPDAIFKLMNSPDVCQIDEVQFKSLLISSYSEDIMKNKSKVVKGIGMTKSDVLKAAIEQADAYIAENPDWQKRLFTLRFVCPVWKMPSTVSESKEKRKQMTIDANSAYAKIMVEIKENNKSLKDWDAKKLADANFHAIAIRPPFECKYNLPEIRDYTRELVPDYSFTEPSDKYTKMHFAFTPGTTCSLNFMVDISLPTTYSLAFGFKLKMAGCLEFMFPSRYKRGNENTFEHFLAFGESAKEYQSFIEIDNNLQNDKNAKKQRTNNNGVMDDDDPEIFGGNNRLPGLEYGMNGMTENPQIRVDPNEEAMRDFAISAGLVSEQEVIQKQRDSKPTLTDDELASEVQSSIAETSSGKSSPIVVPQSAKRTRRGF